MITNTLITNTSIDDVLSGKNPNPKFNSKEEAGKFVLSALAKISENAKNGPQDEFKETEETNTALINLYLYMLKYPDIFVGEITCFLGVGCVMKIFQLKVNQKEVPQINQLMTLHKDYISKILDLPDVERKEFFTNLSKTYGVDYEIT